MDGKKRSWWRRLAAVASLGILAWLVGVDSAGTAPVPPPGHVVYSSLRNGRWRIVVMRSDGTGKTVVPGSGNDTLPVWLPDGRILFNSDRGGVRRIYTMQADGSGVERLGAGTAAEEHQGTGGWGNLVLVRRGPRRYAIRNLAAGTVKGLSFRNFPGVGGEIWPALSPDGARIAFLYKPGSGARRAVYAARLIERDARFVAGPAKKVAVGCFQAWGPDSASLLLSIIPRSDGSDVYLARERADGTWERTRLTSASGWEYFPSWSPDGGWFAWGGAPLADHPLESPTYEIYARALEGGERLRLTDDSYADNAPSWGTPPLP